MSVRRVVLSLAVVACSTALSPSRVGAYADCCCMHAYVMESDIVVVGTLGGVELEHKAGRVYGRARLHAEQVVFGPVAPGDTLILSWEDTDDPLVIRSPRIADPSASAGVRALWLLEESEAGVALAGGFLCSIWSLNRMAPKLSTWLGYAPSYPRTFSLDPAEHRWKVTAVQQYLSVLLEERQSEGSDTQLPN